EGIYENCFSNFCEISAYFRRSYFWNTVYSENGTATRLLSQFRFICLTPFSFLLVTLLPG
ncbi:hypothetical protein CUS64_07200, partial [Enterococcus faecium]